MRHLYEKYNCGKLDTVQLKNGLKHKLFINFDEAKIESKIKNNQLTYKELVRVRFKLLILTVSIELRYVRTITDRTVSRLLRIRCTSHSLLLTP